MLNLPSRIKQFFVILTAMCMFALPMHAQAEQIDETPSAMEMAFDGLIIRPITLVATVLGAGIWILTLPFSALGGNAGEAADVLILQPAEATFLKCLGCKSSGRKIEYEDE